MFEKCVTIPSVVVQSVDIALLLEANSTSFCLLFENPEAAKATKSQTENGSEKTKKMNEIGKKLSSPPVSKETMAERTGS